MLLGQIAIVWPQSFSCLLPPATKIHCINLFHILGFVTKYFLCRFVLGSIFSRVEEDYLWNGMQLGQQSPCILLNTLLYFNTKHFGLRTIEQHLRLSFRNVVKRWNKNSDNTTCIQYEVPALCTNDNQGKELIGIMQIIFYLPLILPPVHC